MAVPPRGLVACLLLLCIGASGLEDSCELGASDSEDCAMMQVRRAVSQQASQPGAASLGRSDRTPIPAEDVAGSLASVLKANRGDSPKDAATSCRPDILACIMNKSYAASCGSHCQPFSQLATALTEGNETDVTKVLLQELLLGKGWLSQQLASASPALIQHIGARGASVLDTILQMLEEGLTNCPPCPSVSCCVGYPVTVIEALITAFLYPTTDQPTQQIFETLASKSMMVWNPNNAETYYNNSVAYYGEQSNRVDTGWANQFLANILTWASGGILDYRKVPTKASARDFAVDTMPEPKGRPLVVGLIADWGCGNLGARRVMEELKKQEPDIVIHLGDTYYSGTVAEQEAYFLQLAQEILGTDIPLFNIPGNHDYYSGGEGFFKVIDKLAETQTPRQEASFFTLRGRKHKWQIIGLDTGLLDSFDLNGLAAALSDDAAWKQSNQDTMTFLPADQIQWALEQIEIGERKGLKTILLSHHQLFSRKEALGYANGAVRQEAFSFSEKAGVFETDQWSKTSEELPGHLQPEQAPAVNTRLLDQFPPRALASVAAWFWGHEHGMTLYEPYAGLEKGRLIGNACIPVPKAPLWDPYAVNNETVAAPWGGEHPQVLPNSKVGEGDLFWNLGFATVSIEGSKAHAKYFQLQDYTSRGQTQFKDAVMFYEEDL